MSKNILLARYSISEDGIIYEKDAKVIKTALLTNETFELIMKKYVRNVKIREEDTEESYDEVIINEKNIKELLQELKNIIKEKMTEIMRNIISDEKEDELLNELRIILEIRNIILQKNEEYSDKNNYILILG